MNAEKPNWRHELINPKNSQLLLIDHQPQMTFGVSSIDRGTLMNNVTLVAKAAKIFNLPVTLTAVETESFSGYIWPQILNVFPDKQTVYERSSMNTWEDAKTREQVKKIAAGGRKKIIMAALWTEVCLAYPAIEALKDGHEVYVITDASGGTSKEAHDQAIARIVQAGGVPITSVQFLLELQRDWAHRETYNDVMALVKEHCGAYGVGVEYTYTMVHKQPQSAKNPHVVVKAPGADKH